MSEVRVPDEYLRQRNRHITIFKRHNKPPYFCHMCGKLVLKLSIHHQDGDHSNNDPENLVATHHPCHLRHHADLRRERGERIKVAKDTRTGVRGVHEYHLSRLDPGSRRYIVKFYCIYCRLSFYVSRGHRTIEEAERAYNEFERTHLQECEAA